jgi:hypothetical protein
MHEAETIGQACRSELFEQCVDPARLVEAVARHEQMAGVEHQAQPVSADGVEEPCGLLDRGGHGSARSRHQLDEETQLLGGLVQDRLQDRGGAFDRGGRLAGAAGPRVHDETPGAEDAARLNRLHAQRERLLEELRVRRRDVHQVRRVDEERTDPALAPLGTELLGGLQTRTGPRARIGDEQLRGLRSDIPCRVDGGAQTARRSKVSPDPHAT